MPDSAIKFTLALYQGPSRQRVSVLRGGSWNNNATYARAANRNNNHPGNRNNNYGFRLCLHSLPPVLHDGDMMPGMPGLTGPGQRGIESPGLAPASSGG